MDQNLLIWGWFSIRKNIFLQNWLGNWTLMNDKCISVQETLGDTLMKVLLTPCGEWTPIIHNWRKVFLYTTVGNFLGEWVSKTLFLYNLDKFWTGFFWGDQETFFVIIFWNKWVGFSNVLKRTKCVKYFSEVWKWVATKVKLFVVLRCFWSFLIFTSLGYFGGLVWPQRFFQWYISSMLPLKFTTYSFRQIFSTILLYLLKLQG